MKSDDKTREHLLKETDQLRVKIAELEKSETERKRVEEAFRESESKYSTLVENASEAITIAQDGVLKFCNLKTVEIAGYSRNELISKPFLELVHKNDRDLVFDRFQKRLKGGPVSDAYSFRIITKSGKIKWMDIRVVVINWEGRSATLNFFRDITERKKMEETIKESEERYRCLSDVAFEAIFISEKGVCLEQNSKAEKLFGYTLSEAIGRKATECIAPKDRAMVMNNILSGYEELYEVTALRKDGSTFPVEIQGKMMHYKGRTVRVTALSDISERKQAEEALRESEEKLAGQERELRLISDSTLDTVFMLNKTGKVEYLNKSAEKLYGYKLEEMLGTSFRKYVPKKELPRYIKRLKEVFLHKRIHNFKTYIINRSGKQIPVEINGQIIKKDGVHFALGTIRDITERKKAEESTLRFSKLFKESLNEIYFFDAESYKFIDVNQAAQKNLGYTMEELSKLTPLDIKPEYDKNSFEELVKPLRKNKTDKITFYTNHQRKDGSLYAVEVHCQLTTFEQKQIFLAIILDISERKRAEEALKKLNDELEQRIEQRTAEFKDSEEKGRLLIESISEGIFGVDPNGNTSFVNSSALKMLGFERKEIIGKSIHELTHHSHADGSPYPLENCPMFKAYTDGTSHHVDDEVLWRKDETCFHVEYTATPMKKNGGLAGAVITFNDTTERKQAEEELRQNMEDLERFSKLAVGREEQMIKLKKEINELLRGSGQPDKYKIVT